MNATIINASGTRFLVRAVAIATMVSGLGACGLTETQRNAGIGAAAGGALGYVISGDPLVTVGGAAAGGLIGASIHRHR